jgi:hypothetical protein
MSDFKNTKRVNSCDFRAYGLKLDIDRTGSKIKALNKNLKNQSQFAPKELSDSELRIQITRQNSQTLI